MRAGAQEKELGMATGLYVLQDGTVMVAYGTRKIPIPNAQYKANGYKPSLDKLKRIPPEAGAAVDRLLECDRSGAGQLRHAAQPLHAAA